MVAHPPTFSEATRRYCQSFSRSPDSDPFSSHAHSLSANDRVIVSRQDGSGWAVAMGTVTAVSAGGQMEVLLDKPVPEAAALYRIDKWSGTSGATATCNLADLCASDSEK